MVLDRSRVRLGFLPGFASGLMTHHELFPAPSFWIRMKRECSDRLWRIEFWKNGELQEWIKQNWNVVFLCDGSAENP